MGSEVLKEHLQCGKEEVEEKQNKKEELRDFEWVNQAGEKLEHYDRAKKVSVRLSKRP